MLRRIWSFSAGLHRHQLVHHRCCATLPETADSDSASDCADEADRRRSSKLRQMALLVAYHGDKYYGMELLRNSGFPTVEEALFSALRRSGAVADGGAPFPPHYSRASRTDRGVSALGQVVSLRMRVWDGVLDDINSHLPPDVRVCGLRRVPPRFSAQTLCDDRLYSYTLPTFAFTPMEQPVTQDYRVSEARLEEVRRLLRQYVGRHSFHSFSPGGKPDAAQMTRLVISVEVDQPYLSHGLEFTTIWIRGASFVLSQIRRMVGLVLAVCRGAGGRHALREALEHRRLSATTAPGLGLVLREARFDTVASAPWNVHGPLRWSERAAAAVSELETDLMRHIHTTEAEEMATFRYLDKLFHNRIGVVIDGGSSSFRSPLGYALKLSLKEDEIRDQTEDLVVSVPNGPTEVSEATPDHTEVIEVTPDQTEVMEATPDQTDVIDVIPDSAAVAGVTPGPLEVIEVTPDTLETTEVTLEPTAVIETTTAQSEVIEVTPDPTEVTGVTLDPLEATQVTPNSPEVRKVTHRFSGIEKVKSDQLKMKNSAEHI